MSTTDTSAISEPAASRPAPVRVTVYHNDTARFMPYEDGHLLIAVASHWLDTTAYTTADSTGDGVDPAAIGDWVYHAFNADLDLLETQRPQPGGETMFLAACVYRLLGRRSVSVGDVIAVDTGGHTHWLACDPYRWRPISAPAPTDLSGTPLSAAGVYAHLADQRSTR
jgi:hypothetical protein